MGKEEFTSFPRSRRAQNHVYESISPPAYGSDAPQPIMFSRRGIRRWSDAVDFKRWSITMAFCVITIIAACILLIIAVQGTTSDGNPIVALGFGSHRFLAA